MRLIFESISVRNFFSYGNVHTKFMLNEHFTTLIFGKSGAGKSSFLLDGLCFALYNKPYRKIKKEKIINPINNKNCEVIVEFSIGLNRYKVIRGIKPNIFEIYCNGELIDPKNTKDYQKYLEENILKINYKNFIQIVVLGTAKYDSIMDLSASDRRIVIDELLDVNIYSVMSDIAKKKLKEVKEKYSEVNYDIEILKEKISLQKQNIEEHRKESDHIIELKKSEIQSGILQIEEYKEQLEKFQNELSELQEKIKNKKSLEKRKQELIILESDIKSKIKNLNSEIKFYESHDDCSSCKQHIDHEFKIKQINQKNKKINGFNDGLIKLKSSLEDITTKLKEYSIIENDINSINSNIIKLNNNIDNIIKYNTKLKKELKSLDNKNNNISNNRLIELEKELKSKEKDFYVVNDDRIYLNYVVDLLKDDGIKSKVINQFIPIINKQINQYLRDFELYFKFEFDGAFNETITMINGQKYEINSFSEGEKGRVNLAILFTFRDISKLKNSCSTNLLVMDEVFSSSLDNDSVSNLINILKKMVDTNIIIISHNFIDEYKDIFDRIVEVKKVKNFSTLNY